MRREISYGTGRILLVKVVSFLIFGFIFVVLISHLSTDFGFLLLILNQLVIFIFVAFINFRCFKKLKKVELSENGFFITDPSFFNQKEVFVPFKSVKRVSQEFFQKGKNEIVTIEFIEPIEFGNKIDFFPNSGSSLFKKNLLVDELNQLIHQHKL
jgi:hypothetical protein